jgi:hypothetical protein
MADTPFPPMDNLEDVPQESGDAELRMRCLEIASGLGCTQEPLIVETAAYFFHYVKTGRR